MTVTGIISAILIGIVVGTLGRLILPGRQGIGAISTAAVGVGAALLGTWVARLTGVEDRAMAGIDWFGVQFSWSWAELGVQIVVAMVGIAIATALTNTVIADNHREGRRSRSRSRAKAKARD
jgi:uncharacterized membrane protein YeaQ/YmgE (transglycosylase-associated protein family)